MKEMKEKEEKKTEFKPILVGENTVKKTELMRDLNSQLAKANLGILKHTKRLNIYFNIYGTFGGNRMVRW